MFRAMRFIAFLAVIAAVVATSHAQVADPMKVQTLIAMVDYKNPPDFRKGTWIRYDVKGGSVSGQTQSFRSTLLVPGEERFWGDDGFWLETWTELRPGVNAAAATLMSYAAFQDSFPYERLQHYMRKTAAAAEEGLRPTEEVVRRSMTAARVRKWLVSTDSWKVDTLGPDTVITPIGTFNVIKVQLQRGTGATQDTRDSTIYSETREYRTEYRSAEVPITHIVREDIELTARRRAWRVGQSQEGAPFQLIERSWLTSRLVEKGEGGLTSMILPPSRQKSLREQFPAEFATRKPVVKTPGKTGATPKSR